MSCGLPVITSTVEATTEIVDAAVGWNIELPLGPDGRWVGVDPRAPDTRAIYDGAVDMLTIGMRTALESVRACPERVATRSAAALERVMSRFGAERSRDLLAVYERTCPDL